MLQVFKALICAITMAFAGNDPSTCDREKVTRTTTPLSDIELFQVIESGHVTVLGEKVPRNRLIMAWAQVAFENGRGRKVYNHNLGNIGAASPPRSPYYVVSGYQFTSFDSFELGANAYWRTINKMCSGALRRFDEGDPAGAAIMLRRCGYYRADVAHYTSNLSSLFYTGKKLFDKGETNDRTGIQ